MPPACDEAFDVVSSDDDEEEPDAASSEEEDTQPAAAGEEEDDVGEEEDDEEEEEMDDAVAPATAVVVTAEEETNGDDEGIPDWLVEAADDVGLARESGEVTPTNQHTKPSLRKVLQALKADAARQVEFVGETAEQQLETAKEEIATLRRANELQSRHIATLKQRYEVLEQRMALRDLEIAAM